MAFWGVEIKPGKPFSHKFDRSRGRLHISQATLGIGTSPKKSLVQCNVGDKSPILLCSLMPDKIESCPLNLEFEEVDEVIFSVLGPRSVHLTGYYLGDYGLTCGHDDDSDSYGEDIQESESEDNSDYDEEDDEDEYEDDFIDDDDIEMFCPPKKNSGVVIEEILDDEKSANGNGNRKRLKKKCQISDSDDDNQQKIVVMGSTGMSESESEDEDGLPVSLSKESAADKTAEVEDKSVTKAANGTKKAADMDEKHTGSKRKIENLESERTVEELKGLSEPSSEVQPENDEEPKKKKKKKSKGKSPRDGNKPDAQIEDTAQVGQAKTDHMDQDHHVREGDEKQPTDNPYFDAKNDADEDNTDAGKKKKKKKKKNKNKTSDSDKNVNIEEKGSTGEKESAVGDKKGEKKSGHARCFDNGLLVEDIAMGKPDGKRASPGNKIFVCYTGKLKKNGQTFDSNVGGPPFKFRLGIGQVIKAWDVGCNGMRIGDKRRITVPPSMGYGSRGAPPHIPPNAWLVFEVELVDVRK